MRFFLESAVADEAKKVREWGLLDGVWLSAAAAEKAGVDYRRAARELSSLTDGPVCVGPVSTDAKGMYKEARELAKLGKDIVVQLPAQPEAMRVARLLAQDQVAVCAAGCYSAAQALIAAKSNVSYVAPAVGALDDVGSIGRRTTMSLPSLASSRASLYIPLASLEAGSTQTGPSVTAESSRTARR